MPKLNLANLSSDKPEVKYCAAKQAIALSEKNPQALYPKLDVFLPFLDGKNHVLKWVAIIIIGNLARVDRNKRIDRLVPKLAGFLHTKELITAANSIKALGSIALAKPKFRDEIIRHMLTVEGANYISKGKISPECRNVVLGHVLTTLGELPDEAIRKPVVKAFLKRQTKNRRPAVREKAAQLMKGL
ncbi:MAG: hypothetical protein PHH01_04335 [Patescibacteria group bacterium]|nr:hypothetical protein [Patescibacteria group bacterium]